MGKLHELLAVESDLKTQAQRELQQVNSLFVDGKGKLVGQVRTYQPLEEEGEDFADEITVLATTVETELRRIHASFGRWMDAAVQKETTNRETGMDVIIDDSIIIPNLPTPALLNLESKLAEIRKVYAAIPTNNPTERWTWDDQQACFISKPRVTYKTKKIAKSHVVYEATPEHPAQVQLFSEDARIGTWTTIIQSGMVTPHRKRLLLERVDMLLRAVKQARQRANDVSVMNVTVAQKLFDFIHRE